MKKGSKPKPVSINTIFGLIGGIGCLVRMADVSGRAENGRVGLTPKLHVADIKVR
jgi:hypothetical protein